MYECWETFLNFELKLGFNIIFAMAECQQMANFLWPSFNKTTKQKPTPIVSTPKPKNAKKSKPIAENPTAANVKEYINMKKMTWKTLRYS